MSRPLITFAIFAFNQEKYVREAIESAFAQTYEPLEIILSDDCSSDQTFDIIQEMAASYKGPHVVITNRNPVNLGTAAHVSVAFSLSQGKLFIVAAGDDISEAWRAEKIVFEWQNIGEGAALIHSSMRQFKDSERQFYQVRKVDIDNESNPLDAFVKNWKMSAYAPTCAYSREIFENFSPLLGGSVIEDLPLIVRSLAIGKIAYIDEPLVKQRIVSGSAGQGFSINQPARWNRFVHSRMTALYNIIRDSEKMEQISGRELTALRRKARKKLAAHSSLIVDLTLIHSYRYRMWMTFRLIFGPAISGGIVERAKFAAVFSFPISLIYYKKIIKNIRDKR